jgi:transposase-like protein
MLMGEGLSNPIATLLDVDRAMETNPRMERGLAISKSEGIFEALDGSFVVPSQSKQGVKYEVKALGKEWVCSCPDFETRADTIQACKHIHAVKFWVAARVELQEKPKPKVFADDANQCGKCGSIRVVKNGIKRERQAFICRDCGHRFTESQLIRGSRYSPEMVSLTLDLYFSGTSLRKTARILNDHFGLTLSNSSVFRWIQKFVPMVSEYAQTLTPELSETWHADELFVKMKGGETERQYKQKNMAYLWNVMDRKTRFLLASKVSTRRDVGGAARAFMEARKNAGESQPERIFTDGLDKYKEGIAFGFSGAQKPEHIAKAGMGKPHANNNRVERLNGTLRERVKVQRGWKNPKSQLAEGQRLHYNFVKPHGALEGQTPAQRAGVGVQGDNKWLALLKASLIPPSGAAN